jgi:hypothetical protein
MVTRVSTEGCLHLRIDNYEVYQSKGGMATGVETGVATGLQPGSNPEQELRIKNEQDISMPEDVEGVFEAYRPIMRIRSKSKSRISKINARLEEYGLEGVLEAIRNCTEALENPEHYWSHRYPIEDFMTPRNIDRFLAMNGRIKANQEESLATAKEELRHYAFYYPEEVERRCARLAEIDAQ